MNSLTEVKANNQNQLNDDLYNEILAYHNRQKELMTFKSDKMPDYVQLAAKYAGEDSELLNRINVVLNLLEFQTDQIKFLKDWKKKLVTILPNKPVQDRITGLFVIHEVLNMSVKQDKAFDFIKMYFDWEQM